MSATTRYILIGLLVLILAVGATYIIGLRIFVITPRPTIAEGYAAVIHGAAPGKDRAVLTDVIAQARALLSDGTPATGDWEGLNAFTPVQGHKHRHDCVLLPFEAVEACLADTDGTD